MASALPFFDPAGQSFHGVDALHERIGRVAVCLRVHFLLDGACIGLLDVFWYVAVLAVTGTAVGRG